MNEGLDQCKTPYDLKNNDIVIDLVKKFKSKEAELFKLVENGGNGNQDIFAMVFLVNDDMQATFNRFTAIKNGNEPDPFVPGESK